MSVVQFSRETVGKHSICAFRSDGSVWVAPKATSPVSMRPGEEQLWQWATEVAHEAMFHIQQIFALPLCKRKEIHSIWISGEGALSRASTLANGRLHKDGRYQVATTNYLLEKVFEYYREFEEKKIEMERSGDQVFRNKVILWASSKRTRLKELNSRYKINVELNLDPTSLGNREKRLISPMGYPTTWIGSWELQVFLDHRGVEVARALTTLKRQQKRKAVTVCECDHCQNLSNRFEPPVFSCNKKSRENQNRAS